MRAASKHRRRWFLLAVLAVVGVVLLRVALWRPLALVGGEPADGYARLNGVVHVHTTLSDGGGTPEEVIRAARTAGLGFLGITDHNNLDAKPFRRATTTGCSSSRARSSPGSRGMWRSVSHPAVEGRSLRAWRGACLTSPASG